MKYQEINRMGISDFFTFENKECMAEETINKIFEDARRREAHILTPKIEEIYVNKDKKTIVIKWQTGETTKVTCDPKDKWDLEKGVMAAITKYVLGNNYNSYNILDKYIKSAKDSKKGV